MIYWKMLVFVIKILVNGFLKEKEGGRDYFSLLNELFMGLTVYSVDLCFHISFSS